jgi:co-chaperonin GroES (HSP10)
MQGGQVLTGDDDHYIVKYNEEALNNQAIAYKSKKDGKIRPLTGWSLLEPVDQEELKTKSDVIEVVELEEKLPTKGRVAFTSSGIEDLGLKVGDVVGFKENRDYRIKIDGKEYYRTRTQDLLYVEEVHNS